MNNEKFIIIDGNSLMHRAYHSTPNYLTNAKGLHTNVIYGFVNMLNKIINDFKPTHLSIAFDRKAPTFRHLEYEDYKAGRKKMDPEMAEQIPVLKEVLAAMNIKQIEQDGFEADDIIGTVTRYTDEKGIPTLVVTGDRDAFQLISDNVHIMITRKGITEMEEFDGQKLMETYELTPDKITDLKGLMGDASDNIPGVPGIGEKTAMELIKQFGSVECAIEKSAEIKKNKVRENLQNYREQAVFSKKLATIVRDMPIDFDIDDFARKEPDSDKLYKLYSELEFKTLLDKLGLKASESKELKVFELNLTEIESTDGLEAMAEEIKAVGKVALKIDDKASELLKQIFIATDDRQYYFLISENTIPYIKKIAEDETIIKVGHDIKREILMLKEMDIELVNIDFDTMIAAYLLNPSKSTYTLSEICRELLDVEMEDYESKTGDKTLQYGSSVKAMLELPALMCKKLREFDMEGLYFDVELPLIEVLADMEHQGFKVDRGILEVLSADFAGQIDTLTKDIYTLAGEEFNINSTKQLGVILFEKLELPVIKKTKTGYSTDVEVLEELSSKHPIIQKILEYRQLVKLKSTYVDGLISLINPATGKIHSKLNQTVTATGRLSSTDPNLQNIPIKTENGRLIRRVFITSDDEYVLVDADYSQIELRVLADISADEILMDSFRKNEDIHTRTASEVFEVPVGEVGQLMRSRAKAVNFGIVYGISDFGLAKDLGITKKEAKKYIDSYFDRYPNVKKYMEDIVAEAKKNGYVTTILKRRRYIPEITAKNAISRNFGERMAMNTPIQGSAADIIKVAMIKVYYELKKRNLKSRLILQVHDELIIETLKSELDEVKQIVRENMENAVKLKVPLTVDLNEGNNWFEAK